jgi:hypothetical protein
MKLFYITILVFSINIQFARANDFNKKVPGRDYTVRDFFIQRSMTQQILQQHQVKEASGVGVEFMSSVTIKTETKNDANGLPITTKKYFVYNRDCGNVELPEKEGIDKLKQGQSVKYKFKGMNNCGVQDWRVW